MLVYFGITIFDIAKREMDVEYVRRLNFPMGEVDANQKLFFLFKEELIARIGWLG